MSSERRILSKSAEWPHVDLPLGGSPVCSAIDDKALPITSTVIRSMRLGRDGVYGRYSTSRGFSTSMPRSSRSTAHQSGAVVAYMVAGDLPEAGTDHVAAVAEMAPNRSAQAARRNARRGQCSPPPGAVRLGDRVVHHALCNIIEPRFRASVHSRQLRQSCRQGDASGRRSAANLLISRISKLSRCDANGRALTVGRG